MSFTDPVWYMEFYFQSTNFFYYLFSILEIAFLSMLYPKEVPLERFLPTLGFKVTHQRERGLSGRRVRMGEYYYSETETKMSSSFFSPIRSLSRSFIVGFCHHVVPVITKLSTTTE